MIGWHNRVKVEWFGTTPSPGIVIGKQGWWFFARAIEDYRNLRRFSNRKLRSVENGLLRKQRSLARLEIEYLYVVAPNKPSIYPEYVPNRFNKVSEGTNLDGLLGRMQRRDLPIIDLRGALIEAKSEGLTYQNGSRTGALGVPTSPTTRSPTGFQSGFRRWSRGHWTTSISRPRWQAAISRWHFA